jgi:hypothetical protein
MSTTSSRARVCPMACALISLTTLGSARADPLDDDAVLADPRDAPGLPCLQAISLTPEHGAGESATFVATYSHCEGAETFRVVQIWFGSEVSVAVPNTGGNFEGGVFSWGSAETCLPGEPVQLVSQYSTLDCAQSDVMLSGNLMIVSYAVEFDVEAFGGLRNVFFDAKGGAGDPEPRLGWTQVGTFDVQASAGEDTGGSTLDGTGAADGSGGSGGSEGSEGSEGSGSSDGSSDGVVSGLYLPDQPRGGDQGCSCRSTTGSVGAWWWLLLLGLRSRPRIGRNTAVLRMISRTAAGTATASMQVALSAVAPSEQPTQALQ